MAKQPAAAYVQRATQVHEGTIRLRPSLPSFLLNVNTIQQLNIPDLVGRQSPARHLSQPDVFASHRVYRVEPTTFV